MKKKILLYFIVLPLIFLSGCSKDDSKSNKEKLTSLGYNNDDASLIVEKLSNENIDFLLTISYDEAYIKMMKNKDFNNENLKKYIEYYDQNNCPSDEAVMLVNGNVNKKYNAKLVSLVNEKYYKKENLDRYYNYLINYPDLSTSKIVSYINSNLDYDYYSTNYSSDLSKKNLILVNKYYKLNSDYAPDNLVHIGDEYGGEGHYIQSVALENYKKMFNDMKAEGLNLRIKSSYRSYSHQETLYTNYVKKDGKELADTYSARPGHSEHQTGLAIDVGTNATINLGDFEGTFEYYWMLENAHKYGFILRYQKDTVNITGYMYEPWHFRYVGIEVATYIKENDITYEEYYEYFLNENKN